MSSDVRDILELNSNYSSKKKKLKTIIEPVKRPQGVHREVWGLISKDDRDQPPLIPTETPKIYKHPKAKLRYGVRKWHWVSFKNPARNDEAQFSHWRCVNDDPNKEYPFAKYNKQIQFFKYTDSEYSQYLNDENWTKTETDFLFDLCKRYDLRFFVIHDRWMPSEEIPNLKLHTIDELKDRYYKVTGIMQKLRTGVSESQIYQFDLDHEQKRREQLEKLFNRTKEQVDEEMYLMEELKKIEIRKKERERKQQDLNKLLTAAVDIEKTRLSNAANSTTAGSLQSRSRSSIDNRSSLSGQIASSNKRLKQRSQLNASFSQTATNTSANNSLNSSLDASSANNTTNLSPTSNLTAEQKDSRNKRSLIFKANVDSGIKFPDTKVAGVSLRSYKMKLPPSVGQKKTKAIDQLLEALQVDQRPIATETVCEEFNKLRSDIVLLYELQIALTNCQYEFESFRARYEDVLKAKNIDLSVFDSCFTTSTSTSNNEASADFSLSNSLGTSTSSVAVISSATNITPQKRISEIFEVTATPSSAPLNRRRQAAMNQSNILKKLRERNP